jgi:hypothetical protein
VQQHAADFRRRVSHENPRARKTSHRHGQRADVILVRMRNQYGLDLPAGDRFEIRQGILPGIFRMHSAIDEKLVPADLKIVRVRADLCVPCEICEFQNATPIMPGRFPIRALIV